MEFTPIYSDRQDLLKYLLENDILEKFRDEMGTQLIVGAGKQPEYPPGMVRPISGLGQSSETPWIYVNPDKERQCLRHRTLFFKCGIIPKKCFGECWKVIVKPQNIRELMLLFDLQEHMKDSYENCWCKCGIEERNYVEAAYGGYFYNNSQREGIARCKDVMKEVAAHISQDTANRVYLKKGCTEIELKFGDSRTWEYKDSYARWERIYDEHFVVHKDITPQPGYVREHVLLQWLKHATDKGDKTATFYNEGKPLYASAYKYYQREVRE